jgi:hypothetical protein
MQHPTDVSTPRRSFLVATNSKKNSTFANAMTKLKSKRILDYLANGSVQLTKNIFLMRLVQSRRWAPLERGSERERA